VEPPWFMVPKATSLLQPAPRPVAAMAAKRKSVDERAWAIFMTSLLDG
jgi:hypothetical protein